VFRIVTGIACIAIMQGLSVEVRSEALTPNRHHVPFGHAASTSINQKNRAKSLFVLSPGIRFFLIRSM
jgi:hypothetical protein